MKSNTFKLLIKALTVILLIFTVIFTNSSYALGKLGHKLVCQLVFDHLSIQNQKKINNLYVYCSSYFDTDIIQRGCRVEFVEQSVQARNRADLTTRFRSLLSP
mgnify:CR=1 FL=1